MDTSQKVSQKVTLFPFVAFWDKMGTLSNDSVLFLRSKRQKPGNNIPQKGGNK